MMRIFFFLISLAIAQPASSQRQVLGIFGQWGAFQKKDRTHCFAIAEPYRAAGRGSDAKPFASVGYWPGRRVGGQVHFRLSRPKRAQSAILLRVGERTFQLVGGGNNAWAANPNADAEIVAAIRGAIEMTIETRGERGMLIREQYQLRGAPSAIDAAAIACARRT